MSIYLISNRSVSNDRFNDTGKENAKREFRVAECFVPSDSETLEYNLIPDNLSSTYTELVGKLKNNSSSLNLNKHAGTARMFADIYSQMLEVKDGQSDCLFFIHGFSTSLKDSLEHIKKLHDIYIKPKDSGIDHLIYVSWPSIGSKMGTYWNDQNDAEETGRVLGALFSKLHGFFLELFEIGGAERCTNRIHLAAHSMGNTVLDYMLQNIPDHKLFHLFGEIFLLNSDVKYDIFEQGSFRKLENLGSRINIYISQSDEVLGVLSRFTKNANRRLGHKGPKNPNSLPDEAIVIDTTNAGRASTLREKSLDHWGYLERTNVIFDIKQVFSGKSNEEISGRLNSKKHNNYYSLLK